ncbi:MAG: hypothetical protein AB9834_05945 [Lentimicrobium sp.]
MDIDIDFTDYHRQRIEFRIKEISTRNNPSLFLAQIGNDVEIPSNPSLV